MWFQIIVNFQLTFNLFDNSQHGFRPGRGILIYVNDIVKAIKHSSCKLYADDLVLCIDDVDPAVACVKLQDDVNSLSDWCNRNLMTLNEKKTQVCWYGSPQKIATLAPLSITHKGSMLPFVEKYTYLGVTVDHYLNFSKHINETIRLVKLRIFQLTKLRHLLSRETSLKIYKSVIVPVFDYCSFIVDGGLQKDIRKLQRLQNRALRICLRAVPADSNVDNIHNICHVVKLKERRKYLLQCFMYKRAAADPTLRRSSRRTRADDKLKMQNKRANSTTYQRSPIYRGIDVWNNLSRHTQLCENIIQFKKCVKPMV